MIADLFFAVADSDNQAAAADVAWLVAVAIAGAVIGVALAIRTTRKARQAREAGRLPADGLEAVPEAMDDDFASIVARLEDEDR